MSSGSKPIHSPKSKLLSQLVKLLISQFYFTKFNRRRKNKSWRGTSRALWRRSKNHPRWRAIHHSKTTRKVRVSRDLLNSRSKKAWKIIIPLLMRIKTKCIKKCAMIIWRMQTLTSCSTIIGRLLSIGKQQQQMRMLVTLRTAQKRGTNS